MEASNATSHPHRANAITELSLATHPAAMIAAHCPATFITWVATGKNAHAVTINS
jgi:hypothetical protein